MTPSDGTPGKSVALMPAAGLEEVVAAAAEAAAAAAAASTFFARRRASTRESGAVSSEWAMRCDPDAAWQRAVEPHVDLTQRVARFAGQLFLSSGGGKPVAAKLGL